MITYILEDEDGISLRASGWKFDGKVFGRSLNTPTRSRVETKNSKINKKRYMITVRGYKQVQKTLNFD